MKKILMPAMRPVPIKTKGLIWYKALWVWLTCFRKWEILEDWYFQMPIINIWYMIPNGFIFDGASIPRILWIVFSPVGILFIPGLLHDFVYRYGFLFAVMTPDPEMDLTPVPLECTRWEADELFKEVAIIVNGFEYLNWLPYMALVFFGWPTWNEHRKNDRDVYADFPAIKRFKDKENKNE